MGVFRTTVTRAADTRHEEALVERVRAALVDGVEPDDRTAAVIGLLVGPFGDGLVPLP
ncbi:GPP34 family phosphoprotein [Streptomyces lincolnensis]|uniref:GPP34 family phosphoprotein n=1 Tax=Streptomyces lincolnensis TaxID=1915 RepID=UPI0037D5A7F0